MVFKIGSTPSPQWDDDKLQQRQKKVSEELENPKKKTKRNNEIKQQRDNEKYQKKLNEITNWLNYLDSKDSNPNDGRLDLSVFNREVAKYGYEAKTEYDKLGMRHGIYFWAQLPDVDINAQAQAMADKYFNIKADGD